MIVQRDACRFSKSKEIKMPMDKLRTMRYRWV